MLTSFMDHHNKDDRYKIEISMQNGEDLTAFADETFDRYLSSLCLNLTGDASVMTKEAYRILQPKGISAWSIWGDRSRGKVYESYGPITKAIKQELGIKEPVGDISNRNWERSNYYLGSDMKATVNMFKSAGFSMVFWWSADIALPVDSLEPWINKYETAPSFLAMANQSKDDEQREKVQRITRRMLQQRFNDLVVNGNEGITHNNICIVAIK